jgi:methyl-accepting chemotaxis protein
MTEKRSAIDSLIEVSMLQTQSIRDMGDRMEQANQRLSDRIDQMGERLGNQISDLAAQVSILTSSINGQSNRLDRIETAIDTLVAESRQNNETAKIQSQNVTELIKTVQQLAIARG